MEFVLFNTFCVQIIPHPSTLSDWFEDLFIELTDNVAVHGKGFYKLLTQVVPDWERRKKRLEQVELFTPSNKTFGIAGDVITGRPEKALDLIPMRGKHFDIG